MMKRRLAVALAVSMVGVPCSLRRQDRPGRHYLRAPKAENSAQGDQSGAADRGAEAADK